MELGPPKYVLLIDLDSHEDAPDLGFRVYAVWDSRELQVQDLA